MWPEHELLRTVECDGRLQQAPIDEFRQHAEQIAGELRDRGWNAEHNAYTQTLDGDELDASALLLALHGFEEASSGRMAATAQRLRTHLGCDHGLLYRHEASPASGEGAFVMCNFWLADFLARGGGSLEDADRVFRETTRFANDLGLLAEEVDPRTGAALGNFPQAFSHIGLIQAAVAIANRERQGDTNAVRSSSTGGVGQEVAR